MRPTAFAIIIYIVFLLTQPCQDLFGASPDTRRSDGAAEISQTDDRRDCEDACSPFCICSCRTSPAGYFSVDLAEDMIPVRIPARRPLDHYDGPFSDSYIDSIWQPPKR